MQLVGQIFPVRIIGGARQGAAAKGQAVGALVAVLKALDIPAEHLVIGHQIKGQGDRLGPLQMGITGHDGLGVGLGQRNQRFFQLVEQVRDGVDLLLQIQPDIHRHLVVSASGGVQALARFSDPLCQEAFDIHMDIFVFDAELDVAIIDILSDFP